MKGVNFVKKLSMTKKKVVRNLEIFDRIEGNFIKIFCLKINLPKIFAPPNICDPNFCPQYLLPKFLPSNIYDKSTPVHVIKTETETATI